MRRASGTLTTRRFFRLGIMSCSHSVKLKSVPSEDTHLDVQPKRLRNASIFTSGARETATSVTSRAARCTTLRSKLSAQNEQLLHPASQSGANMK